MINSVCLSGEVSSLKSNEIKISASGMKYLMFTLAVPNGKKSKSYFLCFFFDTDGENSSQINALSRFLNRGNKLFIQGTLTNMKGRGKNNNQVAIRVKSWDAYGEAKEHTVYQEPIDVVEHVDEEGVITSE